MRVTTLLVTLFILKALGPFFDNFAVLANDAVAERIQVRVQDLPEPFETPSASNGPIIIERPPAANLRVPAGFKVNPFAEDLKRPRWMAIAPNGDVFLTEYKSDEIIVLRDSDDDGTADVRSVYLSGLHHPHGLAFHGGYLYIGETTQIRRVRYKNGALETSELVETVTPKGSLGDGKGHWTRNIVFAPDGSHFYVAVGSRTNRDAEDPPRASVQRFASDGSDQSTFASGLRNPVGIAFYPDSGDLYVVVNERDGLGDGLVPDYLTHVQEGGFYGWPFAYLGSRPDPKYEGQHLDLVERTIEPDILFEAHSAPLGLVFYNSDQFPYEYVGDAFVAFHGSWNASSPTGYKIVRVPFANGRPAGWYENFAVGFRVENRSWLDGLASAGGIKDAARWARALLFGNELPLVWGRPAGLAIGKDGSLLIADDVSTIWRIKYEP